MNITATVLVDGEPVTGSTRVEVAEVGDQPLSSWWLLVVPVLLFLGGLLVRLVTL